MVTKQQGKQNASAQKKKAKSRRRPRKKNVARKQQKRNEKTLNRSDEERSKSRRSMSSITAKIKNFAKQTGIVPPFILPDGMTAEDIGGITKTPSKRAKATIRKMEEEFDRFIEASKRREEEDGSKMAATASPTSKKKPEAPFKPMVSVYDCLRAEEPLADQDVFLAGEAIVMNCDQDSANDGTKEELQHVKLKAAPATKSPPKELSRETQFDSLIIETAKSAPGSYRVTPLHKNRCQRAHVLQVDVFLEQYRQHLENPKIIKLLIEPGLYLGDSVVQGLVSMQLVAEYLTGRQNLP